MKINTRLVMGLLISAYALNSLTAIAADALKPACQLKGSYGYIFNGSVLTPTGGVTFSETGFFRVNNYQDAWGEDTIAFQYQNFNGLGPIWVLAREVHYNGVITPDTKNPCTGTADFLAYAEVTKTTNPAVLPVGTVLYNELPRSLAYTISGKNDETMNFIITSPGTVASGVANKQN